MTPEDTKGLEKNDPLEALRKEVKKLFVDLGLDKRGSAPDILSLIERQLKRPVNIQSYYMAISGLRTGRASEEILTALRTALLSECAATK